MTQKLNVGVVGLGIGEQHAHAFQKQEQCQLKYLYDYSVDQAREVQKRVGAGEIASSFDDLLGDDDLDIISIASYDHLHYEQVVAAFEAGKHVFVEKPLCRTLQELCHIQKVWKKNNQPHLCSNLVLRQAPVYRWLKHKIDSGELGEIYAIDTDYLYGRLPKIVEGWRREVPDYSVMEGGGVHMLDLVMMLTGQRPARVTTNGNRICTQGTGFQYDDFMSATYEFDSSLIVRATANFGCVHRHFHILRVFGTKGTFIVDDMGPRFHKSRDETQTAKMLDMDILPEGKGVLIPGFVDNILNGKDPEEQACREFDLISVIAASDRSHREGKTVEVEYIS